MALFPSTPEPATVTLSSDQPNIVTIAASGKRQSRIVGTHQWRMKLNWSKSNRATFAPLYAFIAKLRGRLDEFTIVLPTHKTPLGVGTGSPVTNGAASAGDTAIDTTAWTASTTGIMKAGDIIKFANHTKVYMITDDVDSGVGGAATLNITPPLIEDVPTSVAITANDVPFTVAMDDDIVEWKAGAPHLVSYSLDLIEHI